MRFWRPLGEPASSRPRRAVAIYTLVIVVPTSLLLYLGLNALRTQRTAITNLREANAKLFESRLATVLVQRTRQLATDFLADPELQRIASRAEWSNPSAGKAGGRELQTIAARHPIVRQVFVIGDRGDYPRIDEPVPVLAADLVRETSLDRMWQSQFVSAEQLERAGEFDRASATFIRLSEFAGVSPRLQAVAAARAARAEHRLGRRDRATERWRLIGRRFPDHYDRTGRPYGLVAALESGDAAIGHLALLDLENGRWDVTLSLADYFVQAISKDSAFTRRWYSSGFREHLAVAAAIRNQVRRMPRPYKGEVAMAAIRGEGSERQVYFAAASANDLVALVVDKNWIASQLLASEVRNAEVFPAVAVRLVEASDGGTALPTPFTSLAVRATPVATSERSDLLVFAAGVLAMFAMLVVGVFFIFRDAARERRAARLRCDFVNGVSHELRTPLSVIRVYAETLTSDPDASREERHDFSSVILHESERLSLLIDRVLEFARVERGLRQYTVRPLSLTALVSDAVERYRPYLAHLGFRVSFASVNDVPIVNADAAAVVQAVVSLVDNATKYSGDARSISIRVIGLTNCACVEVADRGPGVDAADRERIFQPYYRSTRDAHRGGYGLGLHLVAHVMKKHGGRVEVDSGVGTGSTFRLVFPAAPVQ